MVIIPVEERAPRRHPPWRSLLPLRHRLFVIRLALPHQLFWCRPRLRLDLDLRLAAGARLLGVNEQAALAVEGEGYVDGCLPGPGRGELDLNLTDQAAVVQRDRLLCAGVLADLALEVDLAVESSTEVGACGSLGQLHASGDQVENLPCRSALVGEGHQAEALGGHVGH